MWLDSVLTTIPRPSARPTKLAELGFRVGTRVSIPFLDARTAKGVPLRMDHQGDFEAIEKLFDYGILDPATADMPEADRTLQIALKVYYRGRVQFHGPIFAPSFDYAAGNIELVARDPSLRLEHAFLNSTDKIVADGVTLDGEGMFNLLAAGQNTPAQDALDWPSLGIIPGKDTTTDTDIIHKVARGDQIWQTMKDIGNLQLGPDWELEPIETDPAELASGSLVWSTGDTIVDGATTQIPAAYGGAGSIGGLRLNIWADHSNPLPVHVTLIHPDGTRVRIYTGSKEAAFPGGTDWLGNGTTSGTLAKFRPTDYDSIYKVPYPHVGQFRSDRSLSQLYDKPAAGTWKLEFDDTVTDGNAGTVYYWSLDFLLPPPAYCRLNVYDKPVTDDPANPITPSCVFDSGHGADNAKTFKVTPQGDLTVNQAIVTNKHGTKIRVRDISRQKIGTYQTWQTPGLEYGLEVLGAYADAEVAAFNLPVPAVELAPRDDGGINNTLRYGDDFVVGGHVQAVGKRERAGHSVIVRVMSVDLVQESSAVTTDMQVLATVGSLADITDG